MSMQIYHTYFITACEWIWGGSKGCWSEIELVWIWSSTNRWKCATTHRVRDGYSYTGNCCTGEL